MMMIASHGIEKIEKCICNYKLLKCHITSLISKKSRG
jgi:hypothetical protein